MRRLVHILLCLILVVFPAKGQYRDAADSSAVARLKTGSFRPGQLVAPAVLISSGTLMHCFAHDTFDASVNSSVQQWKGGAPERNFDNVLQYAPVAMFAGLDFLGPRAEHGFVDRLVEGSISYLTYVGAARLMKWTIDSPRPNGGDNDSFPSGHSGLAFTGAELVRMEYGWGWGACAYLVAGTVGFMRVYNKWHWASDVIVGAGLGILSAHVGDWLMMPAERLLGIHGQSRSASAAISIAPSVDPFSGALCTSLALRF